MPFPLCRPSFLVDPELDAWSQLASCADAGCSVCQRDHEEAQLRGPAPRRAVRGASALSLDRTTR
jgi:hypothetical protein